jgi:hypothetical protein
MFRHHLRRHRYKLVVGVPMLALLASSLSFVRSADEVCIVPEDSRFVEVGETVTLHLIARADEPINVIGATISVPEETLAIRSIEYENSIIDLWTEEPTLTDAYEVIFSGGILREAGFVGEGQVLTLVTEPLMEGVATIDIHDTQMLAHDGTGRRVHCGANPITLSIRPNEQPSPDLNGDGVVNFIDFSILSARLFMPHDARYDLNGDGKISLADIGILIANMGSGITQSSLALLAR